MPPGDAPFPEETRVGVAMKHVNEPMPDVLARRPDVSAAVAAVIDRATAKDPRDRYASVGEMVRDLEATLEIEAARGGGTRGEATTVLDSVPRSRRNRGPACRRRGGGVRPPAGRRRRDRDREARRRLESIGLGVGDGALRH